MQNVHFSTTSIAELFEVNVSTVKRWIDRGLMQAEITPGGHRRITQEQLDAFIRDNKNISQSSYVINRLQTKKHEPSATWKKLYGYLLKNNIAECRSLVREYYLSNAELVNFMEHVLTPVLRHIGDEWSTGKINIYQEHQMSFLVRQLLVEISAFVPEPKKHAPNAVLACIEGDRHEIPLQMLALVLKMHGIRAVILGTNVPVPEIIRAVEATHAKYLLLTRVLSKIRSFNYLSTLAKYATMKKITLVYGGSGWTHKEQSLFQEPRVFFMKSLVLFHELLGKKRSRV